MWKIEILVKRNGEDIQKFLEGVLAVAMAILQLIGLEVTASAVLDISNESTGETLKVENPYAPLR